MTDQLGESFRQARRELRFQLTTWTLFATWVVGYCGLTAFDAEKPDLDTALGLPGWVVWGVGAPWVVAFVVTVWFAGWFMKDTELVDDFATPESETEAADA